MPNRDPAPPCPAKAGLKQRPRMTYEQAAAVEAVFEVLANDTRLRLLHALVRADELCVTDLAASLGMKPQAVSNQLQRLSDLGILASRRGGTSIHHRLVDRCVSGLLGQGWCLLGEAGDRTRLTDHAAIDCGE